MKTKIFKLAAIVLSMSAITPAFIACSDDDKDFSVEVSKTQFNINRIGGIMDIEVKANGNWTAEIPEKSGEIPWVDVLEPSGQGDGILKVSVDYFSPRLQKQERNTQLIIRCGDDTKTVNLRQYIGLKEGETMANDFSEPFYDLWANKGLGAGYDILTGNDAAAKVLNLFNMKNDPDLMGLVTQTSNEKTNIDKIEMDTTMNNKVGLSVNGKLDVNYAKFKLNLEVDYNNDDIQISNVKDFMATQSVVSIVSRIDVPSFASIIQDPEEAELAKKVFSRGFRSFYNRITSLNPEDNADELKAEIESLISNYGPAVVAGAELGGSMFTAIRYDSLLLANSYKVQGDATADATLGPIEIKGGVSVGYSRVGTDFYSQSQHHITCTGGNKEAINQLTSLLDTELPNPSDVTKAATTWVESINSSDDSSDNTSMVRIVPVGIWQFFPRNLQSTIKAIAVEYYKGRDTCIDVNELP